MPEKSSFKRNEHFLLGWVRADKMQKRKLNQAIMAVYLSRHIHRHTTLTLYYTIVYTIKPRINNFIKKFIVRIKMDFRKRRYAGADHKILRKVSMTKYIYNTRAHTYGVERLRKKFYEKLATNLRNSFPVK